VALTPFTRELGTTQGRAKTTRVRPDQGSYAFVLGADVVGRRATFANGDSILLSQLASAPGIAFLRAKAHLRPPSIPLPASTAWWFDVMQDGAPVISVPVDRVRDLTSVALNYAWLDPNSSEIDFRLRFASSVGAKEVELPEVAIDDLIQDGDGSLTLINLLPDNGEAGVPRTSNLQLDISSSDSGGIVLADTKVFVNGEIAFAGGVFQPGWDGAGSGYDDTRDDTRTLRIIIDPTSDLPSSSTIAMRVDSRSGGSGIVTKHYLFQIEDYTAPTLVGAQARKRGIVRVEFSEAMNAAEVIDPARWTIENVAGQPLAGWGDFREGAGVSVNVAAVTRVTDRLVDLSTDIDLTMAATYRARASGVHDLAGNLVDPAHASADFVAVDTRPSERRFKLVEHVPAMNVREDGTQDLRKLLWTWQEPLDLILCLIDEWLDILDPETAPEPHLDAMLADLGNPFTFALSVNEKRKLVGLLRSIYQQRGTGEGIVNAIRLFLSLEVTLAYPGFGGAKLGIATIGGTFKLGGSLYDHYGYDVVSPTILTDDEREKIRGIAEFMQATNEHLRSILEPGAPPSIPNHLVLGISKLGVNWKLH
jgi:phage tail-like protein